MARSFLFADILIVSATPELARRLRVVLLSAGYTARTSGESQAATQAIRTRPPDLILLDAALPDSYELVRLIRAAAELPFIPIIMVAAPGETEGIAPALDAGADDLLYLSTDNRELLARTHAMLRLKAETDALAELNATLEQKVVERTRDLEQAQASLRHAEKLSSLGRLAATIVHEVGNPLTAVMGLVDLTREDAPADSQMQRDLELIGKEMRTIANLVQQLRSFSKPPSKERRPVILNEVLNDVLLLAEKELRKHKVAVVRELDPQLPPVLASPEQMQEILLNLILNAQDAMPEGGRLTISTACTDGRVVARCSDTGTGIDPEVIERIFEPFFTTKGQQGTGLGLAICHRIISDHGGDIRVESQPGQGATFIIELPRLEAQQEETDVH